MYPVKTDMENIYISMKGSVPTDGASAEILFTGRAQPGVTASDVNIEEVPTSLSLLYVDSIRTLS